MPTAIPDIDYTKLSTDVIGEAPVATPKSAKKAKKGAAKSEEEEK